MLNSEFGCVQFGLILLLWDLGRKKQSACRKQWLNHLGQQMKWQLQETRALQVEFSSILPTDGYRLSLFGRGPIALHGLVHFLNTIGPSLTKVIYAYFDRISYVFGDLSTSDMFLAPHHWKKLFPVQLRTKLLFQLPEMVKNMPRTQTNTHEKDTTLRCCTNLNRLIQTTFEIARHYTTLRPLPT